ncbi:hypothetical protein TNCT_145561 [Trichonephila clavata]|uniref:Uncharacterized protein n=1 Tax=Trichonephila clavata TaxID=2740835 RepID=A0A8X6FS74_TRICU|nr:hypothetical protein TNCT_145561 [Trichonephila clavata]
MCSLRDNGPHPLTSAGELFLFWWWCRFCGWFEIQIVTSLGTLRLVRFAQGGSVYPEKLGLTVSYVRKISVWKFRELCRRSRGTTEQFRLFQGFWEELSIEWEEAKVSP